MRRKVFTPRVWISLALVLCALLLGSVALLLENFWLLLGSGAFWGALALLVLNAVESGNAKGYRKTEKVMSMASSIQGRIDSINTRLDALQESSPGTIFRDDILEVEDSHSRDSVVTRYLLNLLEEVNSFERNFKSLPVLQDYSLTSVVNWLRPTRIFTDEPWVAELEQNSDVEIVGTEKLLNGETLRGERPLLLLSQASVSRLQSLLLKEAALVECAILIVGSEPGAKVETVRGFREIVPVGVLAGAQLFYPEKYVSDKKYSKLIEYR